MNDPYQEGREAFRKGLALAENPYREPPESRKKWEAGWEDAKIEADLSRRSICSEQR